jgi:muramoyltetrapeptide carboxypeptidase
MPDPLILPPALRPGATIGIAAVSGPVDEPRLERGEERLRAKGYRIVEAPNLRRRTRLFAGEDAERLAGYRELLERPDVDAIFFARGGSGAGRLLHLLDPEQARASPRIHLGASDVTALFARLRRAGLVVFYGPMVSVEMPDEDGLDWETVLSGSPPAPHRFEPEDVLAAGRAEGPLEGGCLSLLASLAGTADAVTAGGAVLFWEDVGEEIYRLDRMLTQLERSGTFDRLQAMLIGSVVSRDHAESPERVRDYLRERFAGSPFPVAAGFPAGHLSRPRTLPLGTRVSLDLERGLELSFHGPAAIVR